MHLISTFAFALLLVMACTVGMLAAAPYQELAPRPGHVPVYIRIGDAPLTEIHPGLAEAFREAFVPENLVLESKDEQEQQEPKAVATTTTASAATAAVATTTESDIASFDAVRGIAPADESNDDDDDKPKQQENA